MIKPTVFCDVCGKQKGDVNHWWILAIGEWKEFGNILALASWSEYTLENTEPTLAQFHLCGAECVSKKVNEFLSK